MLKTFIKSFVFRFAGESSFFAIQLVTMMILSRILTPSDFGVVAVVMIVYNFLNAFNDAGFKNIVIQRLDSNVANFKKIYGTSIALGAFLCMLMFMLAPLASIVFKDDRIGVASSVTSITFIFLSASKITSAILEKEFKFGLVSLVITLSALFSGVIAIIMAYLGAGYWSLIFMFIVKSLIDVIAFSFFSRLWLPIFDLSFMRSFFKFGTYITFYNLMYYVSQSVEKFLIGRCDGTASLGYYTRSYTLLNVYERLFPSIVVQVLYPVLGKIKNDKEAISKVYYSALEVMFLVGGILMSIVGAWSEEFTSIIWGRQWGESALSLSILSFSAIAFTQIVLTRMVFISFYVENKLMHFSLFISVLTTVLCLIGAYWGTTQIVVGYCAAAWIASVVLGMYVGIYLAPGTVGRFFLIMGKSLFAVLIFSSFACALKYYLIGYLEINIYVSLLMALMLLLPMLFAFLFVFERGHILKLKECVHGSGR